jgi:hypothetical protein
LGFLLPLWGRSIAAPLHGKLDEKTDIGGLFP